MIHPWLISIKSGREWGYTSSCEGVRRWPNSREVVEMGFAPTTSPWSAKRVEGNPYPIHIYIYIYVYSPFLLPPIRRRHGVIRNCVSLSRAPHRCASQPNPETETRFSRFFSAHRYEHNRETWIIRRGYDVFTYVHPTIMIMAVIYANCSTSTVFSFSKKSTYVLLMGSTDQIYSTRNAE